MLLHWCDDIFNAQLLELFFVGCFSLTGTDLGGFQTDLWCFFSLIWYSSPGNVPIPLKISLYSFRMYSLVIGRWGFFPMMLTVPSHMICTQTCLEKGNMDLSMSRVEDVG